MGPLNGACHVPSFMNARLRYEARTSVYNSIVKTQTYYKSHHDHRYNGDGGGFAADPHSVCMIVM